MYLALGGVPLKYAISPVTGDTIQLYENTICLCLPCTSCFHIGMPRTLDSQHVMFASVAGVLLIVEKVKCPSLQSHNNFQVLESILIILFTSVFSMFSSLPKKFIVTCLFFTQFCSVLSDNLNERMDLLYIIIPLIQ